MTLLDDIEALSQALENTRADAITRLDTHLEELANMRHALGNGGSEADLRARFLTVKRHAVELPPVEARGGGKKVRGAEVTVRMKAPTVAPGAMPGKSKTQSKAPPVRLVVQGTLQRELAEIDGRIVNLMLEAENAAQRPGEIYLLCDVRAGLQSVLDTLPEHDVLLGLVHEYSEQVEAILADLVAGGQKRAKRLLEHDRELMSRLKAMSKADPKNAPLAGAATKFGALLEASKKKLEAPPAGIEPLSRELEDLLFSMHKELEGQGFGGAHSLLFSALKRPPS